MARWVTYPETEPPRAARELAEQVERDGGHVLALYQEPVGDHWQIFCLLPGDKVEASPYQRDLSPTHVKRLTEGVKKLDRFIDPVVALSPQPGVYWTPNGNHRRTVLAKLKAAHVPAILVVEPDVGYQILPLNIEKAHNLKEKSLEVIRMYRSLAESQPSSTEEEWAFQFESAHFITLGLLYEQNKRFAGGAFAPILRRVDKFLKTTLKKGVGEREERAGLVREADEALAVVVARGTGALGQAVTRRLLAEGATVAAPFIVDAERDRLQAGVDATAKDRLLLVRADVTDERAVGDLVNTLQARHRRLDVLVTLVGGFAGGCLLETDRATWDRMLTLNLTATFTAARAAVPLMTAAGRGRVVTIGSRAVMPPAGGFIAYTASKSGVIAFTQALAQELRGTGVTANCVLPSTMDTPANRAAMPDPDRKDWVPVDAVAAVIAFLASDDSAPLNGALLTV